MFVLRVICLCLCVCLMVYTFVRHRYVESYNEVETSKADDTKQKIKAFYEPTELHGKYLMADYDVVSYERMLKGMSKEASDMAQSVTGDANNRVKETEDNAQLIKQTETEIAIQNKKIKLDGASM